VGTRRDTAWGENAVSPVVATILMVAISVVLAAVLYVMATSLFQGGATTIPPTIEFVTSSAGGDVWIAQVQAGRSEGLSNFRISMVNETSSEMCVPETDLFPGLTSDCGGGVTLTFQDLASPGSSALNGGDAFRVSGITTGNFYTINVVWKSTGGIIKSVTLPPS